MPSTATVNYHLSCEDQQAYYIDANGETGKIISPELIATQVALTNIRTQKQKLSFWHDSLQFVEHQSKVQSFDFSDADQRHSENYDRELESLLVGTIGAKEVVIFDHTLRVDDPQSQRKPARNVHSDYSVNGAKARLVDLLGEQAAKKWSNGHFAFVNIWRPVQEKIVNAPLAFVLPESVSEQDWLTLKLIYPDREGEIMGLTANEQHQWVYLADMRPDEVAVFNIYDSQGLPAIAHSAVDLPSSDNATVIRRSIESRALVRYK